MARKSSKTGKKKTQKLPGFEQSIEQLEQIIEAVESGETPLEEGIEQYARGMELVQHCRQILEKAEAKIEQLSLDEAEAAGSDPAEA